MTAIDLCIFLSSYTLIVAFVTVAEFLRSRSVWSLLAMVVALVAIIVTTAVGFYLKPGESYFEILLFLIEERDFSAVVSAGMGAAAALVWVVLITETLGLIH